MTSSKKTIRKTAPSVKLFAQGVQLNRPVQATRPDCLEDVKRGEIKGWSKASRRRMREFLLLNAAPSTWATFGPTFTIPGPPLPIQQAKELWAWFSLQVCKEGWGMVWRLELQQRGQYHWHALIIQAKPHPADIGVLWRAALDTLPPVENYSQPTWKHSFSGKRSSLPGADEHSCHIGEKGDKGSWLRYLQDHCSKAKQEQIPENVGRHWGVVGRKHFQPNPEVGSVENMDDREYFRYVRAMNRLATPQYPNPNDPFGKSLSWTPTRGRRGRVVVFGNPLTHARLLKWTQETPFYPSRVHLETREALYLKQEQTIPRERDEAAISRHQVAAIPAHLRETVARAVTVFRPGRVAL